MKRSSFDWKPALIQFGVGALMFAAAVVEGKTWQGASIFVLLAALAIFYLFGGRRLLGRALHVDIRDERSAQLGLRAVSAAYKVLASTLLVAWLVEIARGRSGQPYYWLCLVAAITYLGANLAVRLRS